MEGGIFTIEIMDHVVMKIHLCLIPLTFFHLLCLPFCKINWLVMCWLGPTGRCLFDTSSAITQQAMAAYYSPTTLGDVSGGLASALRLRGGWEGEEVKCLNPVYDISISLRRQVSPGRPLFPGFLFPAFAHYHPGPGTVPRSEWHQGGLATSRRGKEALDVGK